MVIGKKTKVLVPNGTKRIILHTHPGYMNLKPSGKDINMLKSMEKQKRSIILDQYGNISTFYKNGDFYIHQFK